MTENIIERLGQFAEALEPFYFTESPNTSITLLEGELQLFRLGREVFTVPGSIEVRWLPRPGIHFALPEIPKFLDDSDIEIVTVHGTVA